jgi:hypothetical protein
MLLAGPGIAAAQTGTAQTKTFVSPGAPVISADSPAARNPAVNPSTGRMAGPSAGAAAVEQRTASRGEITVAQAQRWLRYYGYSGIINLHVNRNAHWQAQATHNGRRVKIVLDDRGTATVPK